MDKLVIAGGRPLSGEIKISGAKNAALPVFFACLLTDQPCRIDNVPRLRDIESTVSMLQSLGGEIHRRASSYTITTAAVKSAIAPYDVVRKMRASVLALGPMLARFGEATVALPGGCAIGSRPIAVHLDGLRKMGAVISVENGYVKAACKKLRGAEIVLDKPSVTGTENLMMAAVLASGETVIENAAREPEVADLAGFLNTLGARISGAGAAAIRIRGVNCLSGGKYRIMSDRIEASTYLAAVAAAGGEVALKGACLEDMRAVATVFEQGGVRITAEDGQVRIVAAQRFKAVDVETAPYPGYPTDMQAQLMAVCCVGKGRAAITETIFENRFMHVQELNRMGANIELHKNTAFITGALTLTGAPVIATDLRASASLVIAALAASGKSVVNRIYHLDRGYERMEKKLRQLGASITRRPV